MSIVQVAPDDQQRPETTSDEHPQLHPHKHQVLPLSNESGSNRSIDVDRPSSGNSDTKSKPPLEKKGSGSSKKLRKYSTSRVKSSSSFFSHRSDVFEIEDQVERLSTQLQKEYRSHSHQSNAWNAKKSPFQRFLMCACIRAPRVFSSDEINLYARVGDLLLFREGTTFEQSYLCPEVMRGIKSSLDGKYIPKTRHIKMWNHVGIVVSVFSAETSEYVKHLLYADDIGFRLRKLSEVTNSCVISHNLCSLRPVKVKNSKLQKELYSTLVDDLESIAVLASRGKLLWSNFELAEQPKSSDAEIDEDVRLLLDNPILTRFHSLFVERMHNLSFTPSQEGIQEATRLFYSMLAVHREHADDDEGNGSMKSIQKIASFGKVEETIPLAIIFKSLSVMNDDEGESKQGDHEFGMRLKNMLISMDDNKDGLVSLDEFIDAFLSIPCDIIPVEFDLPSVAMGEMVACLYVALGVFHEDVLKNPKVFFHPQSYSSASRSEDNFAKHEAEKSKKASPVGRITKAMLKHPKNTTFKKDILLRTS
mmetsp:Transcript_28432/g.48060  ORF Transcript_28432/g.48060 Transcript_28432/m.48060 type:complete len:533 (-) Transcript_28432:2918-4516(-)